MGFAIWFRFVVEAPQLLTGPTCVLERAMSGLPEAPAAAGVPLGVLSGVVGARRCVYLPAPPRFPENACTYVSDGVSGTRHE